MGIAQTEKAVCVSVTLPADLHCQIEAKAKLLGASFDAIAATLLRYGLRAQNDQETRLAGVAQKLIDSTDPSETESLGNELGEMIFTR